MDFVGVLGGAGGAKSNSSLGTFRQSVDSETILFVWDVLLSMIFGVLVSKESCLISSRVRNDSVMETGELKEWIDPLQIITDDVRLCVLQEDNDNSLEHARCLVAMF